MIVIDAVSNDKEYIVNLFICDPLSVMCLVLKFDGFLKTSEHEELRLYTVNKD